jgi:hypothetical protein
MRELFRPSILLGLCALYFLAAAAQGQTFDPNQDEPNAQQTAEFRYVGAFLGLTPPPIGWNCTLQTIWYGPMPMQEASCEPNPVLIEQQERERRACDGRLAERHREMRERLGRRR